MSITTLLVANRGEIARRVFRTARTMGVRCIAVYVDSDSDAPFVADADEAVRLAGGYLDSSEVIEAALTSGADAIHPGYGFLAENAGFATAVEAAGLIWVGPSPTVIATMGDKLEAKSAAAAAGVPVLPSSDDPSTAEGVGFPLLVKAAAGGGGKGMHLVEEAGQLAEAVASAEREAAGAFGDSRVFLERWLPRSRHVEIQILGDSHGNLVHLGERECSIQRRHQKIIEESPSPAVGDELRAAMGASALNLADGIGYCSAGTVEFLLDDDTGDFFFLEVNTRLQVEHPVTEEVTGIDLVREQIRVAAGEPLGYSQTDISFSGHSIEARLYAEDPSAGFLPATGTLVAFEPATTPEVRWDSGVETGSRVGVEFDPMLAKVVSHGPTRTEAAGCLALALERLHLGGVTTNRDFLVSTLRHPGYLSGDTTTDFIDRHSPTPDLALTDAELTRAAITAAMWLQGRNRSEATVLAGIPSGWRNARLPAQEVAFNHGDTPIEVSYRSQRDGSFRVNDATDVQVHRWARGEIDLEVDGLRSTSRVTGTGNKVLLQVSRGTAVFDVVPRFVLPGTEEPTGGLTAPMPGVVLELRVAVGDAVTTGQTLVVLEAMKMEHHMKAPFDGHVAEMLVSNGQQVESGAVLLVIDPLDEDLDGTP
ncbi:MAG: biotin carboxylase N-terminal domain-containing protein [Acidimicrobiales bacterium]|nr:biotin carboxylase N-terminal domain-containing protein [Acidimicrobiales bacterium]MDP6697791.1 biotin carboxylase N-terminal domain-containing protein [Acidimicrobiales bacterium]